MPKIDSFEELDIWKLSVELSKSIYKITERKEIDYGLKDQVRRASVSVSSNIAEGFEYNNNKEFLRFLKYSKGSAGEVRSQVYLLKELGFINDEEYQKMKEDTLLLSKKIKSFMNYLFQSIK